MTFVDDNMLATGPVRSARPGSKSGSNGVDADAANQRSAFENAFADAGKKKQPAISIGGKTGEDGAATDLPVIKRADAKNVLKDAANTGERVPDEDGFMKSTLGSPANTALHGSIKTMPEQAASGVDAAQKFSLRRADGKTVLQSSISLARGGDTSEAGKTVDGLASEKIAGLLKGAKADLTKPDDTTGSADEAALCDTAGDPASADVSQLLNLLDVAQTPAVPAPAAQAETSPVMSEFQALAERAGKAKAKDAAPGKSENGDATAVKNATEAGTDQVFRFARADGKGQAVSMSVASDGDKTVVKNDAPASSKAEAVTVLEARRYLGLAPSSNASVVTNQIASNPEWARALQPSAAAANPLADSATGKVLNTLKIQMHPIDLGMVTATLRLKDDELQVEIKVETGDAFRQLSDDQSAMVKALRAQGFAVDQVNIVFNASDSSSANGGQQQPQSQAGQQGREAAGDGAKGQRNDNGGQDQGRERLAGNGGTGDAASGAERNRAGDVYM